MLSLVGSQNFGVNVKELADIVAPTVDIGELYLVNQIDSPFGGGAALAAGFNAISPFLDIPQGELWRVFALSASVITPAGAAVTYAPAIRINGGTFAVSDPRTVAASVTDWNVFDTEGLWLPSGASLGVLAQQITGVIPFSAQALISRLRA